MVQAEWRKPCSPGCTCRKHSPRTYTCKEGCTCARHSTFIRRRCEPGCTCHRHRTKRCEPGCACSKHNAQANRKLGPEERALADERQRALNRESAKRRSQEPGFADRQRAYREANPQKVRGYYLKNRFGITLDRYNAMMVEQDGCCYLCLDPLPEQKDICVDHSHACCPGDRSCGRCVRGLACRWCNQGLGQFRDDPERLRRAALALELAEATINASNSNPYRAPCAE